MVDIEAVFEKLAQEAKSLWAPNGEWDVKPMVPGYSGAQVLKAELIQKGHAALIDNGQYVLKLCAEDNWGGDPEPSRFMKAKVMSGRQGTKFFSTHVPELKKTFPLELDGKTYFAMLMEVAGQSFDMFQPVEGPESRLFESIAENFVAEIYYAWSRAEPETERLLPHELIESWAGYRLQETKARKLHGFVKEITKDDLLFILGGEALVNPLKLYPFLQANVGPGQDIRPFKGLLHGDLHGGNIFVHNATPKESPYQIIDFGLSDEGYIGFDQAYLEVALCLYNMQESDPHLLLAVLKTLDAGKPELDPTYSVRAAWLHQCLRKMRNSWLNWQREHQPTRSDDLSRQILLARIAAGLNWANKPISNKGKELALVYAAWAARFYLESREQELWTSAQSDVQFTGDKGTTEIAGDDAHDPKNAEMWRLFWNEVSGFSEPTTCYVLVADRQRSDANLPALGNIPWTVVFDLDPDSDQQGLLKAVEPIVETRRGFHKLSDSSSIGEMRQATHWIMTAGWRAKGEKPLDYWQWLEQKMPVVQRVLGKLKDRFGSENIKIIFLSAYDEGPEGINDRFSDIANHALTILGSHHRIVLTGHRTLNREYPNVVHIPIAPIGVTQGIAHSFGKTPSRLSFEIPGAQGPVPIPVATLRLLEESLLVLHSSILREDDSLDLDRERGFWRGHPPTWQEMNASIDIPRKITNDLIDKAKEFLRNPPSRTVFVTQKPGTGGTTVLRRVAWELRNSYPTAIVERDSPALHQRLKTLHEISGLPIIVIAEGSCLTEARFDEIYNGVFNDNIRAVFVYLRKDFSESPFDPDGMGGLLHLPDQLDSDEAKIFLSSFKRLTDEDKRLQELNKITDMEQYAQYKIPFFYGLITFDRNFAGIDHFVQQHLQGLDHRLVGLFQYLAVITRYSSEGLPSSFVNSYLRMDQRLPLAEILPDGPFRLIVSSHNRLRLLHPLIAEQVLIALEPSDRWFESLYSISLDLIGRIHEHDPSLNQETRDLLSALFVNRQSVSSKPSRIEVATTDSEMAGGDAVDEVEEDREHFSPIIMKMIGINRSHGRRVFDELVEKFPNEPHFWNHRGRYYMYQIKDLTVAEESLLNAIDVSDRSDSIHFHTYGLVKRRQVTEQLWQIEGRQSAHKIFDTIAANFFAAEQAFEEARKLNRESSYAYISHIQLMLNVLNEVGKISAKSATDHTDLKSKRLIMDWIGQVNDMIAAIHQIYFSSNRQLGYIRQFESNLKELYGDMDGVIRLWEGTVASGSVTPHARRALCRAYVARKDGKWSRLEQAELRRIKAVCEENLAGTHWRDNDALWWFQASIRLTNQNRNTLIDQLSIWQSRPLWSVNYLMSILRFLQWIDGEVGADKEALEALRRSRELVYGRKRFCHFYFGSGPGVHPLVDGVDLIRDKRSSYWFEDDSSLRRINGKIAEDIPADDRPLTVNIGDEFRIPFFNDGRFKPYQDENADVSFFIGFSPMGLRAFEIEHGSLPGRSIQDLRGERSPTDEAKDAPVHIADPDWVARRIEELSLEQVLKLAQGLVSARQQWGAEITLTELEDLIEATLGIGTLANSFECKDIEEVLRSSDDFTFETRGENCYVGLIDSVHDAAMADPPEEPEKAEPENEPEDEGRLFGRVVHINHSKMFGLVECGKTYWFGLNREPEVKNGNIKENDVVSFRPSKDQRGFVARNIRPDHREHPVEDAPIGIHIVADKIADTPDKAATPDNRSTSKGPTVEDVRRYVIELLQSNGGSLNSARVGWRLSRKYPAKTKIHARLKFKSLREMLNSFEEISVNKDWPNFKVSLKP